MAILYSSLIFKSQIHSKIIPFLKKEEYIKIVFTIQNSKELLNYNIEKIKSEIKEIEQLLNNEYNITIQLKSVLLINCKQVEFSNKELQLIKQLFKQFDFTMINSYSNLMLTQLTTHKYCNMIVDVFSQDIVKRFDFMHHFNSGLNHILLQNFSKHTISLGICLNSYHDKSEFSLSKIISSCIQNSKLATKAKVPQIAFKIINDELDPIEKNDFLLIQKSFFKAQPFQLSNQKNYFSHFFEMQNKELNEEIVGFEY